MYASMWEICKVIHVKSEQKNVMPAFIMYIEVGVE